LSASGLVFGRDILVFLCLIDFRQTG